MYNKCCLYRLWAVDNNTYRRDFFELFIPVRINCNHHLHRRSSEFFHPPADSRQYLWTDHSFYRTLYENHQTESGGKSSGLFSDNYADYVCTPCGQSHDSVGYFKKQSYFTFTDMPIINNYRYGSDRPDLSGADAPKRRNSAQSAGA